MSKTNDGGPAFPVAGFDIQTFRPDSVEEAQRILSGMSLRAYYVAHVVVSFDDYAVPYAEGILKCVMPDFAADPVGNAKFWAGFRAHMRLLEADAMIAALEVCQ